LPISISVTKTTVNQDLKALTLNDTFSPKFILYSLIGQETTIRKDCMKSGTTVESIEFDLLKKYKIKVPNLEEQQEIVKKVEALFAYADQLEEAYERAKENIDQLPQSILAKAFKGELVPQDPNDEPASVLLERIQEERAKPKAKKEKKGKTGQMSFT
jgi:type I restriction enzyme, S subunit